MLSTVSRQPATLPGAALAVRHRTELPGETDLPYLVDLRLLVRRSDRVGLSALVGLALLDGLAQPDGLPDLLVLVSPVRMGPPFPQGSRTPGLAVPQPLVCPLCPPILGHWTTMTSIIQQQGAKVVQKACQTGIKTGQLCQFCHLRSAADPAHVRTDTRRSCQPGCLPGRRSRPYQASQPYCQ
jgi:hypothetical protein